MDAGKARESPTQPAGETFQGAAALGHDDVGDRRSVPRQDPMGFHELHERCGVTSGIGMADPGLTTERLIQIGRSEGHG